ncbi:uncharacterized protein PpBr36_11333 [Pyricularia pennisetigena]|nr:uncharacterized protein PpBr36_11333 [Pyricularia pennisetigena]TLS20334.1 hypothetical protein PpBr36_11333 [Pyricularia pennisetigena]
MQTRCIPDKGDEVTTHKEAAEVRRSPQKSADVCRFPHMSTHVYRCPQKFANCACYSGDLVNFPDIESTMVKAVDEVLHQLETKSRLIVEAGRFDTQQNDRIIEALQLLAHDGPNVGSPAYRKKTVYTQFLKLVHEAVGTNGVILCAAGLGATYIEAMGKQARSAVPGRLQVKLSQEFIQVASKHQALKDSPIVTLDQQTVSVDGRQPPPTLYLDPLDSLRSYQEYRPLFWDDVQMCLENRAEGMPMLFSNYSGIPAYVAFPISWKAEMHLLARNH